MKLLKKLVALLLTTAIFASGAQVQTFAELTSATNSTNNLGSRIFKENGTLNVEVAWENDESNPPLVVVAEYDENGRLLLAQRLDAKGGYFKTDTGIIPGDAETKLFVWDGKTHEPIYDTALYEESDIYATIKFAIAENYDPDSEIVSLLLADGTTASYKVHSGSSIGTSELDSFIKTGSTLNPVQTRVVTYTISGDAVKLTDAMATCTRTKISSKEYNANTGKLGAVNITKELAIINAQAHEKATSPSISDYIKFDSSEFETGIEYDGYAYKIDDAYNFLVITKIGTIFSEDSRFAVITRDPRKMLNYDFEHCVGAEALYNGEATTLYWDTTTVSDVAYGEGDVIYFTLNADGFVEDEILIYSRTDDTVDAATNFADFLAIKNNAYDPADWRFGFADGVEDIQIVKGEVFEVKNSSITFGVVKGGVLDANISDDDEGDEGLFSFGLADDAQAYLYDGSMQANQAYKKYSAIAASAIPESILVEDAVNDDIYTSESIFNHAIALVVNGDVVCIFVNCPQ